MFTGIVEDVGEIVATTSRGDGLRLIVAPRGLDIFDIALGDSVAVNGCCLTVVDKLARAASAHLAFDVSAETLRCTAGLDERAEVNLERALRLSDRLDGHLMAGHVDGVGMVVALAPVGDMPADGDVSLRSRRLEIEVPADLARFIAAKGSIAVNGVSLTINHADGPRFDINLIPHTLAVTTLKSLAPGARVNIEVDMLARYVERLLKG